MKVKFDPKINVGNLITIAMIIVSLFVGGFGIYYGMVDKLNRNTISIEEGKQTFSDRALKVDGNFTTINNNIDKIKSDIGDLKTAGAVSQANQAIISKQIDAVQNQIASLQRHMMDNKQNTSYKGKDL